MNRRNGFTLVEILIVVIILGILAAIALPRFSSASANARASMLSDNLRIIRSQIKVFSAQHGGLAPGQPALGQPVTSELFVEHMTSASKADGSTGETGDPNYPHGPYLQRMPVNTVNGLNTVKILADGEEFPAEPSDSFGWLYKPATDEFRADATGVDDTGKPYYQY